MQLQASSTSMALQREAYQNEFSAGPGLVPGQGQHQASSSHPPQLPTLVNAAATAGVSASSGLQTGAMSTGPMARPLGNSIGVTYPPGAFGNTGTGHNMSSYGNDGPSMASFAPGGNQGVGVNPYGGANTSQGRGSYPDAQGLKSYSGNAQKAVALGLPNGVSPVQSGAVAGPQLQRLVHQAQEQVSAAEDNPVTVSQAQSPGLPASADTPAAQPPETSQATCIADRHDSHDHQATTAGTEGNGVPVDTSSSGLDRRSEAQSNGSQPADPTSVVQGDHGGDSDMLAEVPQLIEPPMLAGHESFSDGLFAD